MPFPVLHNALLSRHGIAPAPRRSQGMSWRDFISAHMNVLAGADFFTVEVLTWRGLVTYYVLFFLHPESRRVGVAGITRHPDQEWMEQMARNATQDGWGSLDGCRYVLHDRDTKFCAGFKSALAAGGVKAISLPPRSPNLNAFAERWVRSVKQECLSKVICSARPHFHGSWPSTADTITAKGTIKGKATICCFRMRAKSETSNAAPLNVAIDSAGCSNTTGAPHEYFYQTACT